jgi:hypothetical protein
VRVGAGCFGAGYRLPLSAVFTACQTSNKAIPMCLEITFGIIVVVVAKVQDGKHS